MKSEKDFKSLLDEIYDKSPIAYSGDKRKIEKWVKKKFPKIEKKIIEKYLLSRRIFTQYRQVKRPAKRIYRPISRQGKLFNLICFDLLTLINIASKNKNFKYILCLTEIISHYAICVPLKSKHNSEMKRGFDEAFKDPLVIRDNLKYGWGDRGSENLKISPYLLEKYHLKFYYTYSGLERKSSPAERLIREIERRLFRRMDQDDTLNYVDGRLKEVVSNYNNSPQLSLANHSPIQVLTNKNVEKKVKILNAKKLLTFYEQNDKKPQFKVNDFVRRLLKRTSFQKAFLPTFSPQVFQIEKVLRTIPTQYQLYDDNRKYYDFQLQRVMPNESRGEAKDRITEPPTEASSVGEKNDRDADRNDDNDDDKVKSVSPRNEEEEKNEEKEEEEEERENKEEPTFEEKVRYFLVKTKLVPSSFTRSGKPRTFDKEFILSKKSTGEESFTVNEQQYIKLKNSDQIKITEND